MNARLGIVMRADERKRLLQPGHSQAGSWADKTVEMGSSEPENPGYHYPGLKDVFFEVYSVTHFVRKRLFGELRVADIEYVSMGGVALYHYERFLQGDAESQAGLSEFEQGLLSFVKELSEVAILFAPEGTRLKEYMETPRDRFIELLRAHAKDVHGSEGFIATLER